MGFLTNGIFWAVVTFLVTSGLGLLGLLMTWKLVPRKEVAWDIVLEVPVLSVDSAFVDDVQITFQGKPVHGLRLYGIRVWNLGNTPIEPGDYERPFTFTFGEGATVLDAFVVKTQPEGVHAAIETDASTVILNLKTLNARDAVDMAMYVDCQHEALRVDARLVGASVNHRPFMLDAPPALLSCGLTLAYFAVTGMGGTLLAFASVTLPHQTTKLLYLLFSFAVVPILTLLCFMVMLVMSRRGVRTWLYHLWKSWAL